VQRLARDVTKVVELWEKVTRARVTAVMAKTHAIRVEEMAHERIVLLATTHGEVHEAARRVITLEGELRVACKAHDAIEEKLPSLPAKAAAADQRWVAVEE
jgi:hypothetical protein